MLTVSAILLAAGESRRMGQPKQLMPLGDRTMLEHAVDNLLGSRVGEVIVVVGHQAAAMVEKIGGRPVKVVVNGSYLEGMSTSIAVGLGQVSDGMDAVMLALADQPFIESQTINVLLDAFESHGWGIAVPVYRGRRGHPVIFDLKYRDELRGLRGDAGGRVVMAQHPGDVLEVEVGTDAVLTDLDDPRDYRAGVDKLESAWQRR